MGLAGLAGLLCTQPGHIGSPYGRPAGSLNWARKLFALASWSASSAGSGPSRPETLMARRCAAGVRSSSARCCASMSAACTGRYRSVRSTCCSAVCGVRGLEAVAAGRAARHRAGRCPSACKGVATSQLGRLVELRVCSSAAGDGSHAVGVQGVQPLPPGLLSELPLHRRAREQLCTGGLAARLSWVLRFSNSGLRARREHQVGGVALVAVCAATAWCNWPGWGPAASFTPAASSSAPHLELAGGCEGHLGIAISAGMARTRACSVLPRELNGSAGVERDRSAGLARIRAALVTAAGRSWSFRVI